MWTEFCAAIKGVEMAHIQDGVKKHLKEKEEKDKTEAAIAGLQCLQQQQLHHPQAVPLSPMSSVSQAMQATTLEGQQNTQTAMGNPHGLLQPAPTHLQTPQVARATYSAHHLCRSWRLIAPCSTTAWPCTLCSPTTQQALRHGRPSFETGR